MLGRQKHVLSQSTTPFACTLKSWAEGPCCQNRTTFGTLSGGRAMKAPHGTFCEARWGGGGLQPVFKEEGDLLRSTSPSWPMSFTRGRQFTDGRHLDRPKHCYGVARAPLKVSLFFCSLGGGGGAGLAKTDGLTSETVMKIILVSIRAHAKAVVLLRGVLLPSKCLLESPFLEPLLRHLLRTLPPCKAHCKTPSENPS